MSKELVFTMKNTEFELKDPLYYDDLMCEIKGLAGYDIKYDGEIYLRITERERDIKVNKTANDAICIGYCLSPFNQELYEIVRGISKKVGRSFSSMNEISKYPLLVKVVLLELEKKKIENELLNHLKLVVKDMELEHAFSLGEGAKQCVCLNKNDNLWEVYIVERGTSFEKSVFEECYDACLEVIHQLADSKQMYEEAKENFVLVRKLMPNK